MGNDKFLPDDSRLCDYELDRIVRNVLAEGVTAGRIPADDVEFLQLWDSGTYFQTAPVPVLFPYDKDIADVARSTKRYFRYAYYDDIVVEYAEMKFRVLRLRGERALPVLLNWLKERGFSDTELMMGHLCVNGSEASIDLHLGNAPLKLSAKRKIQKPERVLSNEESIRVMESIKRHHNGAILAGDVKSALNMQIRMHGYTPTIFAKGAGVEHYLLMEWRSGHLLITPDEMSKICTHLGIANLFENLPYKALTKSQKMIIGAETEKCSSLEEDEAAWYEQYEHPRIQSIFDKLKSHPNFYDAERYGGDELERVVWRAIADEKVEGSLSVEELLESMGDEGVMGGTWVDIVDSWRYHYKELEEVVRLASMEDSSPDKNTLEVSS